MSFEKAKADLEEKGLGDHVIVLSESSATVAEAAHALGVEPASIAKTLSVLQGEKPVLIVTEGTAKLDNHKYKSLFHMKAKMIPYDEVETYVGHAPGGVCPFGVNEGVAVYLDESLRKFAALPVPAEAQVLPGHGEFSTFGEELDNNYFIRSAVRGNNDLF